MRLRTYSAHDIEVLQLVADQRITGYRRGSGDSFRTLDGSAYLTRQIVGFEGRGLLTVNRKSPIRYELGLTNEGRKITTKYRARAFTPKI